MAWVTIGCCWVLIILGWSLYKLMNRREKGRKNTSCAILPRGSSGWPFIGETLDFIASAYTPRPVSFMDKRKCLYGRVFRTHLLGRGVIVSTDPEVNKITFEVLVRVLMGVGPGEDLDFLKQEYGEFIKGLICLPINFSGTQLYRSLKAKERLLDRIGRVIEERRIALEESDENGVANVAVDVMLRDTSESNETSQRLPLDFISGNIIEMMIPGEDSVPMVMALAVKFLSDSPIALSQLVEENMDLKRQKARTCSEYTWMDYMSLPFTQSVISETLRMGNIINAAWRKALQDVEIKGFFIPKGWCLLASFSSVHMDEENYEDPYQFHPWRWEKTRGVVNNNTFTPFGGGQRLCPGQELSRLEISIFLHHLVTTYRWEAKKDDIVNFPTVKMKQKLPITIIPIDHYDTI